jgi:hypothetical protein
MTLNIAAGIACLALLGTQAHAKAPACHQDWMPSDAPAFCAWTPEPSLPQPSTYHAVATYDHQIYVLGGFRYEASTRQVVYYDSVLRSSVGLDGHLSAWTVEPSFAGARSGAAVAVAGDCLFLSGGSSSNETALTYYGDLQAARIQSDGRVSAWTTSPNQLHTPRSNHSLVVVGTRQGQFLQAVAGVTQTGGDTVHLDTIETAKIEKGCTIGPWMPASYHLKGGRSTPQALVLRDNTIVVGGWGDLDLVDIYDDVQVSAARADGSPSPWWSASGRLNNGIYGHATVASTSSNYSNIAVLLSIGGQPGVGAYANWISYSYLTLGISLPDTIGIWRIAPTGKLPAGRAGLAAALVGDRVYVIGGSGPDGRYDRDVLSAQFDFGTP